jgi:hypothetical protein
MTIPFATTLPPQTRFTKIWRIRNTGSCTWTSNYAFVFTGGELMNGPTEIFLPGDVEPGGTVDIAVDLVAPSDQGRYIGKWNMRVRNDEFGPKKEKNFVVAIQVINPTSGVYFDFMQSYCTARWHNAAKILPCPGKLGKSDGFTWVGKALTEDNPRDTRVVLYTHPEMLENGWIAGTYPYLVIQAGDHFVAELGCLAGNKNCDVNFELHFQVYGQNTQLWGEWREKYDEAVTKLDLDLTPLAGNQVAFWLVVRSNGPPDHSAAYWRNVQILR